jgi:hypothetical protein
METPESPAGPTSAHLAVYDTDLLLFADPALSFNFLPRMNFHLQSEPTLDLYIFMMFGSNVSLIPPCCVQNTSVTVSVTGLTNYASRGIGIHIHQVRQYSASR